MNSQYVLINPKVKIRWTKIPSKETIKAVHILSQENFSLNKKTLKLLELCDGTKTKEEIAAEFKREYPEIKTESIQKILKTLLEKDLIIETEFGKPVNPIFCAELEYPADLVALEITNKCNLRCLHCYNNSGPGKTQFSIQEIDNIIHKLDKMNVGRISLSGGEPLLHPNFFDIVKIIKDLGILWSIFSNAVLINEKMVEILVNYGIKKVTTSLDGATEESHEFLRGVKGSFEKTMNAIKILKEYDVPVEVHCAIYKKNLEEVPTILNLLKSLDINEYIFSPILYMRPDPKNEENNLAITMDEYIDILPKAVQAEYDLFGTSQVVPDPDLDCRNCGSGTSFFMIKSDGRMVPCPQSNPKFFSFGNAVTDDIKKAWNTAEILKKLRDFNYKSIKECSTCKYQLYCKGGCPVMKYEMYNDAFKLDPYTCKMMETLQPFFENAGI